MNQFFPQVYVTLACFSFAIALILFISHSVDRRSTSAPFGRFDRLLLSLLVFCMVVVTDAFISRYSKNDLVTKYSYFFLDFFAYLLTLTYTLYASEIMSRNSGEKKSTDKFFRLLYAFFLMLLLILAPTGRLFTAVNGEIIRGDYFLLSIVYVYLSTVLCVVLSFRCKTERRIKEAYVCYLLMMITGFALEEIFHNGSIMACTGTISVTLIYLNVYSAHYRQRLETERELTEEQMRMMLWQMQPHFIYNSLSCIQQLCKKSPGDAEKALGEFAEYLRGDIDNLSTTALIPLQKELEFTRHFVNLEKYRFGNRLSVEYDINDIGYLIPPLTIQPLVENAIHYGICSRIDGGTVKISTFLRDGKHYITVSDDGIGFDTSNTIDDGRSHVGLSNVRHRIENMSCGELLIESAPNKGTTVTIILM